MFNSLYRYFCTVFSGMHFPRCNRPTISLRCRTAPAMVRRAFCLILKIHACFYRLQASTSFFCVAWKCLYFTSFFNFCQYLFLIFLKKFFVDFFVLLWGYPLQEDTVILQHNIWFVNNYFSILRKSFFACICLLFCGGLFSTRRGRVLKNGQ